MSRDFSRLGLVFTVLASCEHDLRRVHGDPSSCGLSAVCRRRLKSLSSLLPRTSSRWWRARGMGLFASHPLRSSLVMTCTLAPSEEHAVWQPGPPPLLCARRRLRPVHLEVAFSITARSLTFHVDSQVPLTSFLSPQAISSAALLPKESVGGRTRFTRRGRHLPLFRGRARYRAKTPAVVHRSFEQSSKCNLVIPLAGKMVRGSHTRFVSNDPRERVERFRKSPRH